MSLTKVGIVIGVVISNATVAQCADWFGQRLFDAFAKDVTSPAFEAPAPDASAPVRRIPPTPFDSLPFPSADWQIGGTPIIGDPGNVGPWPLMEAIYAGPNGDAWKRSRIQIYGWEKYSEHSVGITWWPDKLVTMRPELRFDHSYDTAAFDNGTRRN